MRGISEARRGRASEKLEGACVVRGVMVRRPRSERTQDSTVLAARRKGAVVWVGV